MGGKTPKWARHALGGEGTVRIGDLPPVPELPMLGYVFQSPNLFPWLTVLENIRFGLRMAGREPAAQQRARAMHYAELVGIAHVAEKLPHELSGGMRQRVALARVLVLEPGILLMDEPFAALDAITRQAMQEEVRNLWRQLGQTIVFITHDIEEAVFLADRVLVLGPAPHGIQGEFEIALAQPRDAAIRHSPQFTQYRARISGRIASAGATTGGPFSRSRITTHEIA
jgi:NitT/TauT family transport system ATP-binding protein